MPNGFNFGARKNKVVLPFYEKDPHYYTRTRCRSRVCDSEHVWRFQHL